MATGQTRFTGFDGKIQGHLEDIYKVGVSPALISNVVEAVMEEVKGWQCRPMDSVDVTVYLDARGASLRRI